MTDQEPVNCRFFKESYDMEKTSKLHFSPNFSPESDKLYKHSQHCIIYVLNLQLHIFRYRNLLILNAFISKLVSIKNDAK